MSSVARDKIEVMLQSSTSIDLVIIATGKKAPFESNGYTTHPLSKQPAT